VGIHGFLNHRVEELGLKKKALAEKMRLSPCHVSQLLLGKTRMKRETFLELCGYLGLNHHDLRRVFYADFDRKGCISAISHRAGESKGR
jgi:transcriptional regulator with XRE-family HTH domain